VALQENEPGLFTISLKAILMDKKGRILMMAKAEKNHWDLPGGKLDQGENMTKGLQREVLEETGLNVQVGTVIHVGARNFDIPGKSDRVMIFYMCECDQSFEKIKLSAEHTDWRMIKLEDIDSNKLEINPVVRDALQKAFAKAK
jgi:8-oxo-dGTP diphosphatase